MLYVIVSIRVFIFPCCFKIQPLAPFWFIGFFPKTFLSNFLTIVQFLWVCVWLTVWGKPVLTDAAAIPTVFISVGVYPCVPLDSVPGMPLRKIRVCASIARPTEPPNDIPSRGILLTSTNVLLRLEWAFLVGCTNRGTPWMSPQSLLKIRVICCPEHLRFCRPLSSQTPRRNVLTSWEECQATALSGEWHWLITGNQANVHDVC